MLKRELDHCNQNIVSRLAPTPSGFLHIGNVFSFVVTWLLVKQAGGKLLLRIDDLDQARVKKEYVDDIFYTLDWLQMDYDLGPQSVEEFYRHYSQQLRMAEYNELLEILKRGGILYACNCSRKAIALKSDNGLYPFTCKDTALGFNRKNIAWRVEVPETTHISFTNISKQKTLIALAQEMGDFVVRKKDKFPSYQLASMADDLKFGVNLIVRGKDLLKSTAAQLYLAQRVKEFALDSQIRERAETFLKTEFYHHPLLRDQEGKKFSKSAGSTSIKYLREKGVEPVQILRQIAYMLRLPSKDILSLQDVLLAFSEEKLPKVNTV